MKATCKNSANLEQETKTTKIVTYPLLSLASSFGIIMEAKSGQWYHFMQMYLPRCLNSEAVDKKIVQRILYCIFQK